MPRSRSMHRWADVMAVLTGVALIGMAISPGDATALYAASRDAGSAQLLSTAQLLAGCAAIAGVLIGQRSRRLPLARALLLFGAAILLGTLIAFQDFGLPAMLSILVPAAILAGTALGVGPVPTHGRARTGRV